MTACSRRTVRRSSPGRTSRGAVPPAARGGLAGLAHRPGRGARPPGSGWWAHWPRHAAADARRRPLPAAADARPGAVDRLAEQFDADNGGFGRAPKFPPSMVLEFLLRHDERTGGHGSSLAHGGADASRRWPAAASTTSSPAGSPATAVDAGWVVPHFEKMLYDNALLLRGYLHWWRATGVAAGRADRARDRRLPAARSAHRRGRVRLRARRGHRRRRGADLRVDARPAARGARASDGAGRGALFVGDRRRGRSSTARRPCSCAHDPDDAAWFAEIRAPAARRARDAAAAGARRQGRDGVERAGDRRAGRGRRAARRARLPARGRGRAPTCCSTRTSSTAGCAARRATAAVGDALAVAEDYGDLADGLLVLHQATADRALAGRGRRAARLRARALRRRRAAASTTPATTPRQLVRRPRDPTDNAAPSGSSALAGALLTLRGADRLGRASRGGRGSAADRRVAGRAASRGSSAGRSPPPRRLVAGPVQVARRRRGRRRAADRRSPGVSGRPARSSCPARPTRPACRCCAGRPLVAGKPAAYVCRGMVCDLPVSTERRASPRAADRFDWRPPAEAVRTHSSTGQMVGPSARSLSTSVIALAQARRATRRCARRPASRTRPAPPSATGPRRRRRGCRAPGARPGAAGSSPAPPGG